MILTHLAAIQIPVAELSRRHIPLKSRPTIVTNYEKPSHRFLRSEEFTPTVYGKTMHDSLSVQ